VSRPSRIGDDRGAVAGIEVLPFGLLVFVVGILIAANAWAVIDARLDVANAAAAATRAYVEAGDETAAVVAAHEAASTPHRKTTLDIASDGPFRRCGRVAITASADVPAVRIPFVAGFSTITVQATRTELVDPFRSGLPGEAQC